MNRFTTFATRACALMLALVVSHPVEAGATPQGPGFIYQGRLKFNGQPATLTYDFECKLFDASTGGNQISGTLLAGPISADENGLFTMFLDFGPAAFDGSERWLQIAVRQAGGGAFITLSPRQPIAAAPYAAFALNVANPSPFAFNGANAVFSGGSVGIGTSNPQAALHVTGTTRIDSQLRVRQGNANSPAGIAGSLLLENDDDNFLSMLAPATDAHAIFFGRPGTTNGELMHGGILYNEGGNDTMQFLTGGAVTRMTINGSHVGIGTDNPAEPLHVVSSADSTILLERTGGAQLMLSADASSGEVGTLTNSPLHLRTFNAPRMTVDSDGEVGVGTIAPAAPLHVREGSAGTIAPIGNASLVLERSSSNFLHMYAPDANETGVLFGGDSDDIRGGIVFNSGGTDGMHFRTGGNTTRMSLDATGNLGIGTTAPTASLHIGGVAGTDGIRFPDNSLQLRAAKVLRANVAQAGIIFAPGSNLLTLNVPGAVGASAVNVSYGADLGSIIIASARVSAANTVQVRIFNPTAVNNGIPASTWFVAVFE